MTKKANSKAPVATEKPKKVSSPKKTTKTAQGAPRARKTVKKANPFTPAKARKWFLALNQQDFIDLCRKWNEQDLNIKLPKGDLNYDGWINYFKKLPPNTIRALSVSGLDMLPTEGYAALSRWHDIIKSPHRIDKIYQAQLTNQEKEAKGKSITDLAAENDQMGVLMALRDNIASKLEKGVATRDLASLSRQLIDVTDQIKALERKAGPKKDTKLAQLLDDMPQRKKPRSREPGARTTRYRPPVVTIDDLED